MKNIEVIVIAFIGLLLMSSLFGIVFFLIKKRESEDGKQQMFKSEDEEDKADEILLEIEKIGEKTGLELKLIYANWSIPVAYYRAIEILISVVTCIAVSIKFNIIITIVSLTTGPLVMGLLLEFAAGRRFNNFDRDYPAYLLSMVGLLKTGMNATGALDTAAQSLDNDSLVKEEVLLMLERLKFGVSEEKSIGVFGEDIDHPEIELFVQALILSKRVGGNLSETLERLARQVRQRQVFRNDAKAAVGLQKGSIVFILVILVSIESYLYVVFPEAVVGAIQHKIGWQIWQVGILLMMFGIWLLSRIVKIKV